MSKEKDSQFMKNIFLGDELDVDLRGLNFNSIGLSLSDINIDENDVNNVNNNSNAPEEPLSDLSDNQNEEYVKGKKNEIVKRPNTINNIKTPLSVNRKEKLTKIIHNNQTTNNKVQATNSVTNNNFNVEINNSLSKTSASSKQSKPLESKQNKEASLSDILKPEQINEKDMK